MERKGKESAVFSNHFNNGSITDTYLQINTLWREDNTKYELRAAHQKCAFLCRFRAASDHFRAFLCNKPCNSCKPCRFRAKNPGSISGIHFPHLMARFLHGKTRFPAHHENPQNPAPSRVSPWPSAPVPRTVRESRTVRGSLSRRAASAAGGFPLLGAVPRPCGPSGTPEGPAPTFPLTQKIARVQET